MKLRSLAFLALGALLAGCNTTVVPQCPSAAMLSDASTITVFRAGAPADPSGEAYTVAMGDVQSKCTYAKNSPIVSPSFDFKVRAVRAPTPDAATYHVPYFLVISQGERILSKKNLTLTIDFAPGSAETDADESLGYTDITLEPGHPPTDYQMLVGFQLSDAQRAYNQRRDRFTP